LIVSHIVYTLQNKALSTKAFTVHTFHCFHCLPKLSCRKRRDFV